VVLDKINPNTFHLPNLGPKLTTIADKVYDGLGIVILKGLNPDKYSPLTNVALYTGITSYIAPQRGIQGREGDFLSERFFHASRTYPD
jgi:hypothetical protein